jgi:hypothetical protein
MEGWGCAGWGSWGGSTWALIVAAVGRIVGGSAWGIRAGDDCEGGGERGRSTEAEPCTNTVDAYSRNLRSNKDWNSIIS